MPKVPAFGRSKQEGLYRIKDSLDYITCLNKISINQVEMAENTVLACHQSSPNELSLGSTRLMNSIYLNVWINICVILDLSIAVTFLKIRTKAI